MKPLSQAVGGRRSYKFKLLPRSPVRLYVDRLKDPGYSLTRVTVRQTILFIAFDSIGYIYIYIPGPSKIRWCLGAS